MTIASKWKQQIGVYARALTGWQNFCYGRVLDEITPFPGGLSGKSKAPQRQGDQRSTIVSFPREQVMSAEDQAAARAMVEARLAALREEHQALEQQIAAAEQQGPLARLELQRLKKRKLQLKDMIVKLSARLTPDIIA